MRQPRSGKIQLGTIVITTTVVVVIGLIIVWMFGGVTGEEFSPQRFTMRRFHYWQIPILRVQIWPVTLTKIGGTDDDLARHIRSKRMTGGVSRLPVHWDIMSMDEVGLQSYRGDASILTNYLRQPGAVGLQSLLEWSEANPSCAQELWSLVARMAHEDLYPAIPELIEAARRLKPDETFAAQLRQLAVGEIQAFAEAERVDGDETRAAQLLQVSQEISAAPFAPFQAAKDKQADQESPQAETDDFSDVP